MILFSIGIACVACLLGFLVGASESPVAGIALTATFGIVATGLALHQRTVMNPPDASIITIGQGPTKIEMLEVLQSLGSILIAFSVMFTVGMIIGVKVKHSHHSVKAQPKLFWEGMDAPESAREALDWLVKESKPFYIKETPLLSPIFSDKDSPPSQNLNDSYIARVPPNDRG